MILLDSIPQRNASRESICFDLIAKIIHKKLSKHNASAFNQALRDKEVVLPMIEEAHAHRSIPLENSDNYESYFRTESKETQKYCRIFKNIVVCTSHCKQIHECQH